MFKIFVVLSIVIIAYSVGFNILLSNNSNINWFTTITRGMAMFVGELEFNDNIVENTNEHKANFEF